MPDRSWSPLFARVAIRHTATLRVSIGPLRVGMSAEYCVALIGQIANCVAALPCSWSITNVRAQNPLPSCPASSERYVARTELAAIMGVSVATIDRMVAAGMPSVTWGRRTRRFRPSAALAWALAQERAA